MASIVTYTDKFGDRSLQEHALRSPSFLGDRTPPAQGVALDAAAVAFCNAGRWIALCPSDGCSGAEYVNFEDPLFFCCECRNSMWANQLVRVRLPDEKLRSQVEAYLAVRPVPQTRNWLPGETVQSLRDENRAHGVRLKKSGT